MKIKTFLPMIQSEKLQIYLRNSGWEAVIFSNEQLESKIVAAMLRYLGGMTDLSFVLELAEEIRGKYKDTSLPLHYALEILHDINQELDNQSLHSTDTKMLHQFINDAQKVITKKNYQLLN
jgi:hypothetical protein